MLADGCVQSTNQIKASEAELDGICWEVEEGLTGDMGQDDDGAKLIPLMSGEIISQVN